MSADATIIYLDTDTIVVVSESEPTVEVIETVDESPTLIDSIAIGPQGPPGELGVYTVAEYEALAIKKVAVIHGTEAPPAPTGYPDGMMYFKY